MTFEPGPEERWLDDCRGGRHNDCPHDVTVLGVRVVCHCPCHERARVTYGLLGPGRRFTENERRMFPTSTARYDAEARRRGR